MFFRSLDIVAENRTHWGYSSSCENKDTAGVCKGCEVCKRP